VSAPSSLRLPASLAAWGQAGFADTCRDELAALDRRHLPLQAGLQRGGMVHDGPHTPLILDHHATPEAVVVRAGIVYGGIVAGCNCADDPSPIEPMPEYCEIEVRIDRASSLARIRLLED